jgi:hypothetical protein
MRYQLQPFYVEAFQWYPGITHPRIYASVAPVFTASVDERINPVGTIPYAGGEQAWVLETLVGNTRRLEPGDWVVISEDTLMLCVIDDEVFPHHYVAALQIPPHVRSRTVEI